MQPASFDILFREGIFNRFYFFTASFTGLTAAFFQPKCLKMNMINYTWNVFYQTEN